MKKHAIRILLGVAVLLVFIAHAAGWSRLRAIDQLEAIAYDARLLLTMPRTMDPRVVIIDIDEKSLAEEGRWPWRRDRLAALVDKIFERHHVAVLGFDVFFPERDESSALELLRQFGEGDLKGNVQYRSALEALAPRLEYDRILAESLKGRPVVLGYYFSSLLTGKEGIAIGAIPKPVLPRGRSPASASTFPRSRGTAATCPNCRLQRPAPVTSRRGPIPTACIAACRCSRSTRVRTTNLSRWRSCAC